MEDQDIEILLVEDNPGDARLTEEVFRNANLRSRLSHLPDGDEVLPYLRREGKYGNSPRPHLILLDLNMPRKNGHQVLAEIKSDDRFKGIPVIVLSSSQADEDIQKVYRLNANCYVCKPFDLRQYEHVVRVIEEFWLRIVKLPAE